MAQIDIDKFVISLMRYFGNNKGIATTLDRCLFSLGLKYVDTLTGGRLERVDQPTLLEKIIWESGEQKTVDKVEPKFKVGEWIINAQGTLRHIINVDKGGYQTDRGWLSHDTYEKTFHLWTIQDAKDGDVLSYVTDEGDLWIMIYWSLYEPYEGHVHYHALLVNDNFDDKGTCCICIDNLKPATKEQRDTLFAKMHEAGYEWDAEKKDLKKIEQKPAEWSEEDENCLKELTQFFENLLDCVATEERHKENRRWLNWLKSLRPQNTWKPSDEHIHWLKWAINRMPDTEIANDAEAELRDLLEQLNKLREE